MLWVVLAALALLVGARPAVALPVALGLAALVTAGLWRSSQGAVLAVIRARPADPKVHARLHNLVDGLCVAAGVTKPDLYVIDDDGLNVLVAARSRRAPASLAVTTGLLNGLSRVELEAVLARELAQVKSQEVVVYTVASTLVAGPVLAPDLLASKGSFAPARPEARLLAPLTSMVSRLICAVVGIGHDDVADAAGVRLTRYPPGLVSALEKLSAGSTVVASASKATAHMWLASPLPTSRFDTHLPLEPRINALKEL